MKWDQWVYTLLIVGTCWSELAELFPGWWSAKYFGGLHDISLMVQRLLFHGYYISFLAQPDRRNFWLELYNTKIKQQLCGEKRYHMKLFRFCCHLCCLCIKLMLLYWLQFLLVPGLVIWIIPSKVIPLSVAV